MREDGAVSPVDRLSALDAAFLDLETARAPLHVGWTMRFEGEPPSLGALRRHLASRLDRVPRFRRRVAATPAGPVWVDDRGFDVGRHVAQVTLRAPGGPEQLRGTAGALLGRALEPDRPLWRLYLIDGLRDGGFALVGQAHHALVDGIAAVEVAMLLFDVAGADPVPASAPSGSWRPAHAPTTGAVVRQALRSGAADASQAAAAAARLAAQPPAVAAGVRAAASTATELLRPAPSTRLDGGTSAERLVAFATASLDGAREAGRRRGATVNDVLLAAATLSLGRALRRRGDRPVALKALVPVDVRGETAAGALGNAISFMTLELPVAETDPTTVLRAVRDRSRAAKAGSAAGPLASLARAADLLPAGGRRVLARTAVRAASFNTVVSNVPGPPVDLALLGRRLAAVHPAVPILDGDALTIGALSYAGRLHVGLYADAVVLGDLVEVARDLESAFDALRLAPVRPQSAGGATPWRERARARRGESAGRA